MSFLSILAGLFVLGILWLVVFQLFYSSCNEEDEHRIVSAKACAVLNPLAASFLISVPVMAAFTYYTGGSLSTADYIAKLEDASTFIGKVDCEDDRFRFSGTQVLDYDYEHKTYSTKYPVQLEQGGPFVCQTGLKPPLRDIERALKDDQAVIKEAITAELTNREYPEEINERQRAIAKRVAAVLNPAPWSKVQLEVSSDLSGVKADSPLVKVPVSATPAPSPQDLGISESLSRQISGQ